MRILMLCESFLSIGGVAEVVDNLAAEFVRLNHQVAIVWNPFQTAATSRVPHAHAEYFPMRIPRQQPITWRHPERLLRHRRADELLKLVHRWNPDIVNLQGPLWERLPAALGVCHSVRIPAVLTLHDLANRDIHEKIVVRSIRSADCVTFVSEATRFSFERLAAGAKSRRVILNGVDCEAAAQAMAAAAPRPYVFCAARLNLQHKALDTLVQAFATIAGVYPELDLLISGDGPDRERLTRIVEANGLGVRVKLLGVRPRNELWSLYKGATLFAMPSHKPEGLGLAFLESMACGRPVIGTRSGGTPEIVRHEENGLLVDHNEPSEVAAAIQRLLENREEREHMGCNGRDFVWQNYGWAAVAQQYLEVYAQTLASGRR